MEFIVSIIANLVTGHLGKYLEILEWINSVIFFVK